MASQQLNYRHLHQFWVVAQEGSLVAAGRRLGIGHSTISAQLRSLEETLGGKLLLRRPRGVRLTPLGEMVRSYCDDIFRLGGELLEATATHRGRATRLRVGMLPWIPRSLLYETLRPALAKSDGPVRGADGGFPLEVTVADLAGLCSALVTGRMHVALSDRLPTRPGDTQAHGQIMGQLIGESRIGFYGTQRLVQRYQPDFPRSLDGAPLLLPTNGTTLRDGLANWFAEEGIRPRVVGEFDDLPTMQGFGARGHGLVPLRQSLAEDVRHRYGLWPVGLVPGLKDRLYTLTLGRRMRHPGIQPLVDEWRHRLRR